MSLRSRQDIEAIFQEAADLAAEERATFLDRACGCDGNMRLEVEALLACLSSDGEEGAAVSLDTPPVDEGVIGSHIGPYRLLELIGEGGFGSVFMAEQEEPVRRRVALKIIKLGMDTRQVIARFEAERQALAMMEHPNIARVLDAGSTESGRPYFVMELVQGVPITKYCDREGLSTRERLKLFSKVCYAVQHAHQKGIIHRDLKPSNVLVTLHDGVPVPKVIDFGIAKATRGRLTDKTLFTAFMQFVGTPQYMSPEQAEMSGLDIDTRSDVYSLGVLLYELLTGTTPCDAEALKRASYTELQRIIREEDPPTPSRRLSTLGDRLADIARRRGAEPQLLSRLVRGDLDWIVMRALEKDRQRRYESASALAADVQRHLANEVVLAGPPGSSYRLYKLIRRHRVGFAAGSAVAVALVLGLAMATWGLVQARRDRDRALAAEQLAQQQADTAQSEAAAAKAINAFLNDMLTSVDPMQVQLQSAFARETSGTPAAVGGFAHEASLAEMIRRATQELDSAFAGKPELEAESRETLGMTLRGLGRYADAEPLLRAALDIRLNRFGERHPDTLRSQLALGDLLLEAGKGHEAERLVRAAYDAMRTEYGREDPRTLSCASVLAMLLSDIRRVEESDKLFKETLKTQERILGDSHRDTLTTMWKWSISCLSHRRLVEGQALGRRLYELAEKSLGPDDSLNILSKPLMGWWYIAQYQYADAEAVLRPGLEQCRRILGPKHPFTYMTMHCLARSLQGAEVQEQRERLHRAALEGLRATRGRLHWHTILTTTDFARWLDWRGELVEAEHMYRAIVADARQAFGPADRDTVAAMYNLAAFLERAGKIQEALLVWEDRAEITTQHVMSISAWQGEMDLLCRVFHRNGHVDLARAKAREMIGVLKECAQEKPDDPAVLNAYAWTLLTCIPSDCQDVEAALSIAERAVTRVGKTAQRSPVLDTLALAHARLGRKEEAAEVQRQSLAVLPAASKADLRYCAQLVRYLIDQGDTEGADEVVREGVEVFRKALGDSNPLLAREFNRMGIILANSRHLTLATSLLEEGLEINRRVLGEEHEEVARSLQNVGIVRRAQGDLEAAAEACYEALNKRRRLFGDTNLLVANTLREWGETCYLLGRMAEARGAFEETLDVYRRLHAERMPRAVEVSSLLAQVLVDQGELELAEPLARSGWATMRELFGDSHLSTCESRRIVAEVLIKRGRLAEAERELRACMRDQKRCSLDKDQLYQLARAERTLGCCLYAMRKFDSAEKHLLTSYHRLLEKYGSQHCETQLTRSKLAELYARWGKPRVAEQWREEIPASGATRTAA